MNKLTLKNGKGKLVACLYLLPNGNLHEDSWLGHEGWPPDEDPKSPKERMGAE